MTKMILVADSCSGVGIGCKGSRSQATGKKSPGHMDSKPTLLLYFARKLQHGGLQTSARSRK
jgi:hypothetical protein